MDHLLQLQNTPLVEIYSRILSMDPNDEQELEIQKSVANNMMCLIRLELLLEGADPDVYPAMEA